MYFWSWKIWIGFFLFMALYRILLFLQILFRVFYRGFIYDILKEKAQKM